MPVGPDEQKVDTRCNAPCPISAGPLRRQWGSDRRREPLPLVAPKVSERRMAIGRLAIVLTVSAWAVYVAFTIEQQFIEGKADSARLVIEAIVYLLMVTGLATSAMAYLITRIGFFYRSRGARTAPPARSWTPSSTSPRPR